LVNSIRGVVRLSSQTFGYWCSWCCSCAGLAIVVRWTWADAELGAPTHSESPRQNVLVGWQISHWVHL
jgi:hypothetical protein